MSKSFQVLDLSRARQVFGVGDIHGHFTVLEQKLADLDFDPEQDHVISVGDLVDRGPENERALEFCQKPWFHWVRGNHEDLMRVAVANESVNLKNGQKWMQTLMPSVKQQISDVINDAPVILEVITPTGKRCGFVHACFPSDDWRHAEVIAEQHANICMWDRTDVLAPKKDGIRNIDWVFHGHSPLTDPRTVANVAWIDTGVFHDGGRLTVVKLP